MNKYRYERKCIEFMLETQQTLTPTGIEGNAELSSLEAMSDETDSEEL